MKKENPTLENVLTYLNNEKITTIDHLKILLNTTSRMTVFRRLSKLGYISSCSHSGKYYALKKSARFNKYGIWRHKSVLFSKHGTLKNTLRAMIYESPDGFTATELKKILRVKVEDSLYILTKEKSGWCSSLAATDFVFIYSQGNSGLLCELSLLCFMKRYFLSLIVSTSYVPMTGAWHIFLFVSRKKISGVFVYLSGEAKAGKKQELSRTDNLQSNAVPLNPDSLSDELNAALLIFFSTLDEKQRRLYAGYESLRMGRGGDKLIADIFDLDRKTVARGRQELLGGKVDVDNIRKSGGGRRHTKKNSLM